MIIQKIPVRNGIFVGIPQILIHRPKIAVPTPKSSIYRLGFSLVSHPAMGVAPFMETSIYLQVLYPIGFSWIFHYNNPSIFKYLHNRKPSYISTISIPQAFRSSVFSKLNLTVVSEEVLSPDRSAGPTAVFSMGIYWLFISP